MAGILNSKTRIMDVVITKEGRRQLAAGKFVPMFASFTDGSLFYQKDKDTGADDASQYIYFEAGSRQQDQIVVENDDSGLLIQYNGGNTSITADGRIFEAKQQTIASPTGVGVYTRTESSVLTSSFASTFEKIRSSITQSLEDQLLITTDYPYEEDKDFAISKNDIVFNYNNISPFREIPPVIDKSQLDSLFLNTRLSHLDNFKFLPPVYESDTGTLNPVGNFVPLKATGSLEYEQLLTDLRGNDALLPLKEKIEVDFTKMSTQNNIFMQIFEGKTNDSDADMLLTKLDCIDFGEFKLQEDRENPFRRVFFAGKVYLNDFDSPSYVNLFTIIAE
jgi:hypothetical protein